MKHNKGFTLVEMLVVVAIVAALVAIVIPISSSYITKAKEAADEAAVRNRYADDTAKANLSLAIFPPEVPEEFKSSLHYPEKLHWNDTEYPNYIVYSAETLDGVNLFIGDYLIDSDD